MLRGRGTGWCPRIKKCDPFKYFNSSEEIIRLAVMLYVRFPLSLKNVEDLLHERGDRQVVARDRKWECATVCHAAMLFAQSFQRSNAAARL